MRDPFVSLQVARHPGHSKFGLPATSFLANASADFPGSSSGRLSVRWIPKAGSDAMCIEGLLPDDVNIAIQSLNPDHLDPGHLTTIRLTPDVRL